MNLSRIFIERPVMTALISFAILLFGGIAFQSPFRVLAVWTKIYLFIHSMVSQTFAEALGVSIRTVWRLIGQQKIRTVAISLRRRGIPAEELDRIVAGGIEQ